MSCVIFNSAAPAGARPLMAARRGVTAQDERRSTRQDNGKKPKCAKFHRNHSCRCERKAIRLHSENRAESFGISKAESFWKVTQRTLGVSRAASRRLACLLSFPLDPYLRTSLCIHRLCCQPLQRLGFEVAHLPRLQLSE